MNKLIKSLALGVTATALVATGAISSPANAASPLTVTVSKTANLALAGEVVTITITGIPANAFVYAYQCAATSVTPRPSSRTVCVDAGQAIALTNDSNFIGYQGILDGSQPQNLQVVKSFTAPNGTFDCTQVECAIFIRRGEDGQGNGSDTTFDQLIPITFETAIMTTAVEPKLKKTISTSLGFDSGVSKLSSSAKSNLKKKVADFRLASTITITATAGVSTGKSEKAVTKLAKNRAATIKNYLVQQGISASKIVIKIELVKSGKKPTTKVVATP